jgi:DNA-binding NtrC family response regulator
MSTRGLAYGPSFVPAFHYMPLHDLQSRPHVLVADDQADVLEALRLLLKTHGYDIDTATSPSAVLSALEKRDYDALLLDMNYTRDTTSGKEGLDLLQQLGGLEPDLPIIVMTAWGSVEGAVEAMRRGARDYIEKPWDNARLMTILGTQVELGRALRRARRLESENRLLRRDNLPRLIAESPKMKPILQLMERVGPSDANVLITGEHGTGKELVAQWLHASSARAQKPFIPVNMGGLSEGLFESELFGHVKGSFTDAKTDRVGRFELADTGTIFLDEIGNVPFALQAKLLRVLQTGDVERVGSSKARHVDVRVVSATNARLNDEVAAGRFREDLLFRINTIELHLPPLRERREDVPPLAMHFLRRHAARYRKHLTAFDPGAMQLLLEHAWPGNIRELDHAIERAVLLAQSEQIRGADLALRGASTAAPRLEELTLEEVERLLIQKALSRYDGNVSRAAQALGLSRSALYRRIAAYEL